MLWYIKKRLDCIQDFCVTVSKLYKTSGRTYTFSYLWWTFNLCFPRINCKSNQRKNHHSKTPSTCYWQTAITWRLLLWSIEAWMGKKLNEHMNLFGPRETISKSAFVDVLSDIWYKSLSKKILCQVLGLLEFIP